MKNLKCVSVLVAVFFSLIFLGSSCENNTVVGSDEGVTTINNVSFTVTGLETSSSSLKATGTVKNTGSSKITSPWYIECQFYTDSTLSLKLGGDNSQIGVPLEPGLQTIWTLQFSSPDVSEGEYPNFRVSNFRAFYNE